MPWAYTVGVLVHIVSNRTNMSVWPDVVAATCGHWLVGEYQQTTAPSNALSIWSVNKLENPYTCVSCTEEANYIVNTDLGSHVDIQGRVLSTGGGRRKLPPLTAQLPPQMVCQ